RSRCEVGPLDPGRPTHRSINRKGRERRAVAAGVIGRKLGMTRIFGDDGTVVPVSVIEATPNSITRLRTPEQDGYAALQQGAGVAKRLSKPAAGQFKELERALQKPARVREFRVDSTDGYELGQSLDVSLF